MKLFLDIMRFQTARKYPSVNIGNYFFHGVGIVFIRIMPSHSPSDSDRDNNL
jgi:hypothetical protein